MDRVRTYGLAGAGGVFVIATVVVALGTRSDSDVSPPEVVPRGLVLGLLFVVPAIVGLLGVSRRDPVLLAAAGVAAVAPSWLSVATLPLILPGVLLLAASAGATRTEPRSRWLVALLIVGLQVGALAALLGTAENRCWVAYPSAGGYTYQFVAESESSPVMGGAGQPVAAGCDGGSFTEAGVGLAGVLAVGSLALAFGAPSRRREATERSPG